MAREHPARVLRVDLTARAVASEPIPDALLERYYRYRGRDDEGRPARETVERLGLADVADDATPVPEGDVPASGGEADPPAEVSDDD